MDGKVSPADLDGCVRLLDDDVVSAPTTVNRAHYDVLIGAYLAALVAAADGDMSMTWQEAHARAARTGTIAELDAQLRAARHDEGPGGEGAVAVSDLRAPGRAGRCGQADADHVSVASLAPRRWAGWCAGG